MKTTNNLIGVTFGLGFLIVFISLAHAQEEAPFPPPPRDVSSVATMVSKGEPGEPLVITGTVYRDDKKTPYAGLILYFYQTDATGVYNKIDGSWQAPRLRGWAKTDARGRYEIRTIKPGSYPNRREPAHIHVTMKPANGSPVWLESFLFEGDPNLRPADSRKASEAGSFTHIVKIQKQKDGTFRWIRDFVIASRLQ